LRMPIAFASWVVYSWRVVCRRELIYMPRPPVILVVDDEPAVARAHRRGLERGGLRVEVCTAPLVALGRINAGERFDAVICDGQMPALRGVDFFRRAVLAWPDLRHRIIFVSGGLPEDDARFIRDNDLPFLPKPLGSAMDLVRAVRALLGESKNRRDGED
jgi:CheY-like chemotaxis protein